MRMNVIGLSKSYYKHQSEVRVLQDVNVEIPSGSFASITGPSGVGKSTFLHILGTLDAPTEGKVVFDDKDVFSTSPAALSAFRNRNIGFVFQFHHLLPEFSALENVKMPALICRSSARESEARARHLLDLVGLSHRLTHRPGELSGGEQQRVALARSLMNQPKVLLADEPTGNLDEETGKGIFDIMHRLNDEEKISIVLVTHNPRLAASVPMRLKMDVRPTDAPPGFESLRIVEDGTPSPLRSLPALQ